MINRTGDLLTRPRVCFGRLYTGIHAKPKSKLKQGAVSESTTALNVDHRNTSAQNADQKNALVSTGTPSPSPLAAPHQATVSSKASSAQDMPADIATAAPQPNGGGVVGSSAAQPVAVAPPAQKKDGVLKAQAEKKKIDARKKSLKRL